MSAGTYMQGRPSSLPIKIKRVFDYLIHPFKKRKFALLDTTTLIDYDNHDERAIEWLENLIQEGWKLSISIITEMEMLKGFIRGSGKRQNKLMEFYNRLGFLRETGKIHHIYQITLKISRKALNLLKHYPDQYTPTKKENLICDILIAATALEHNVILFTHNEKDFSWIKELKIKKPSY